MVYIVLGNGFEESEAVIPCDLLRRAGVETKFAGIGGTLIKGSNGITVQADCTVEEMLLAQTEMIVLPGGLGGVQSIKNCPSALEAVRALYAGGKYIAAICAAPTILAELGITDGRDATCYPGLEGKMGRAKMHACGAVTDEKVITGRAAGKAFDFSLALIEALRGEETAKRVAAEVVYGKEA